MSLVESDYEEGDLVEAIDNSAALQALNRSEIDIQIQTAKRFPRSIKQFRTQALEMATLDEETAASMFYALPRGGKKVEGPSVRLAEVVGSSWGNLRYGARIVATDDRFVTAQGMCFDLEKNIAAAVEVKRRITDKHGRRFNDDMIQVTSNAACSIALRQAIFKVVPFAFVKGIYEEAKLCSIGKATSMAEKRFKAFDWFKKAGATEEQVLACLGRKGIEDVTIDDLITLRGLFTAIKDGQTTLEEALKVDGPDAGSRAKKSDLKPSGSNGTGGSNGDGGHEEKSEAPQEESVVDAPQAASSTPETEWPELARLRGALLDRQSEKTVVTLREAWKSNYPDYKDAIQMEADNRIAEIREQQKQQELIK